MSGLRFEFEWQDAGGVRGRELAATWARFEAYLDGVPVTEFQDLRAQTIRKGPFVSLYPVAEWLASNWWSLWFEERAKLANSSIERHSLGTAREGFALPDLRLWPEGGEVLVEVEQSEQPLCAARFLNSRIARVPSLAARDEVTRLIEAVLEKLRLAGVTGTPLEEEWQLIGRTQADAGQGALCEYAARLGLDPYDLTDDQAAAIEHVQRDIPPMLTRDFFDAVQPHRVLDDARLLQGVLSEARAAQEAEVPFAWRPADEGLSPHEQGYRQARELRGELHLNGKRFESAADVARCLRLAVPGDLQSAGPFDAVAGVSALRGLVFRISPRPEPSRLFAYCRAIGEAFRLSTPEPMLLTRGRSVRQKRSRAFAAEFLAPAHLIREFLRPEGRRADSGFAAGDEECEELGEKFGVSPMVIRHQIEDHGIATYAGANYGPR